MSPVKPGKKREILLFKILVLLLCSIIFGDIATVHAQAFKRIKKNGVIYYYFSNRGEGSVGKPYLRTGSKIRVIPVKRGPARKVSNQELEPVVQEASRHFNLPPQLIKAVIRVESNFVLTATSPKGAQGLMQLMPGTAEDLQVGNPYDIRENVWAGTRYLYLMLAKFGNRLPLALAAYNSGPKRVEKHQDIPPIKETQVFVRDVCINFLHYRGKSPKTGN